ncbi:hypothetical protein [Frigoribacterium sp. CFBP 13707]|nr:hypothetical protein [Frigoribacterium sp. CFBP 13707]MBD8728885.1 hypothetical protein [Frigoribacterium sp. CFBP 13707]
MNNDNTSPQLETKHRGGAIVTGGIVAIGGVIFVGTLTILALGATGVIDS